MLNLDRKRPANSILLEFQDQAFQRLGGVDPRWNLRWVDWNTDGRQFVAVGDNGLVVLHDGKNFREIERRTTENLRCASYNPRDSSFLIVGNKGTILQIVDGKAGVVRSSSEENLRRVQWAGDSSYALIVGNRGTVLLWDGEIREVPSGVMNNLRSITWSEEVRLMFVSGNYFGDSMVPSATFYRFSNDQPALESLSTTEKTDLIAMDAGTKTGQPLLAVGYDLVWQEPRAYTWNGKDLKAVRIDPSVPPHLTAVSWSPGEDTALVGTGSVLTPNMEDSGAIFQFQEESNRILGDKLCELRGYRIVRIVWKPNPSGSALVLASRLAQTFST